jgi:hypothetical protein
MVTRPWLFRRRLPRRWSSLSPLPTYAGQRPVCIRPSCTSWPHRWHRSESGLWARLRTAIRWKLHYPRGPRSSPGYSVPVRHHLIGPIRPARRHIAISPHGGLYVAFAVRERLGDPRAVPGFRCTFLPGIPSSPTRGTSIIDKFQRIDVDMAFAANRPARHSQYPAIRFAREVTFVASRFTHLLRTANRPPARI